MIPRAVVDGDPEQGESITGAAVLADINELPKAVAMLCRSP
ncbi:hypothetical protein [Streptomyces sp. NPDC048473]